MALRGYVVESSRGETIGSHRNSFERYETQKLRASSVDFGWSGVLAELRTHARGVISWNGSQAEKEVVVAISPSNSPITRSWRGAIDRTIAQRGTICLCRPEERLIEFAAPQPQILHICLPSQQFSPDSLGVDVDHAVQELGYQVTVVKDATASYSAEHMHAALDVNLPNYASAIVSTQEIMTSISAL